MDNDLEYGWMDNDLKYDELCDHNINLSDNVIEFDPSVNYDNIVLNDRVNMQRSHN